MPSALEEAASLVSDDLCILEAQPPGRLAPDCGGLCARRPIGHCQNASAWTLVACTAPCPDGDPELASRIGRIFTGLQPGVVLERFNWTVQASNKRYTPDRPEHSWKVASATCTSGLSARLVRKLPDSGAVVFTIRICLDPLLPILEDGATREAFEDAWLGASDAHVRGYKHWHRSRAAGCRSLSPGAKCRPDLVNGGGDAKTCSRPDDVGDIEGDFVLFLIGMRVHKLWKVWKWVPVFMAPCRACSCRAWQRIRSLVCLHTKTFFSLRSPYLVQYWRSFEDLHAYSVDKSLEHLPAWKAFNQGGRL